MGHRQQMTDEIGRDLKNKGYDQYWIPLGHRNSTTSESEAKLIVESFRKDGFFARIFCVTNKVRLREYVIYYKDKKNK